MRQVKIFVFFVLLSASFVSLQAQDISGISIAVSASYESLFETDILPRFQENHPNVLIEIRTVSSTIEQNLNLLRSRGNPRTYLEAMEQLANLADVLIMSPTILSPEITRTGYVLDLAPLMSTDNSMNPDNFVPAAWDAFQWDGGRWAIPLTVAPQVMIYDHLSFDELGLSYPTSSWTLEDYINTATTFEENGQAGLFVPDSEMNAFMYMLYGESIYRREDEQFNFESDTVLDFMTEWQGLLREGIVTNRYNPNTPMQMTRFININQNHNYQGVLINEQAPIDVFGVAISSGTRDIQLAYELASFLSTAPEMTELYPTAIHARTGIQNSLIDGLSENELTLRDEAIANAFSPSLMLFDHMLARLLGYLLSLPEAELDVAFTLVQNDVNNLFMLIDDFGTNLQADVEPPVVESLPEMGEVIIDFAVFVNSSSGMSNRRLWEDTIEEFLANNPDIDQIELNDILPFQGYWDEIREHTCIHNYSYSSIDDIDLILPLDPLIQADPTFDDEDIVGNIMSDVQLNGVTYGLPHGIFLIPIMRYDRELFAAAGLPEPDSDWTVSEFVDALQQLDGVTDGPPLHPFFNSTATWEMLMAGFGAAPIDYSTEIPTPYLIDEAVIASVQQVLDLPKNGLSTYYPAATYFGYGQPASQSPAIIIDTFRSGDDNNRYGYVNFPRGINTTPMRYATTQSFIFADEEHPEACYLWLREISRHPELFDSMPAFHSIIESEVSRTIYGESGVATFQDIATRFEDPNQIFIGSLESGAHMYLARAFDRYVLENADLQTELELAQVYITEFYACAGSSNTDTFRCLNEVDSTIFELIEERIIPEEYRQD